MDKPITVELSTEDAEVFRLLRKHQDVFMEMVNAKVFDVRRGSVVLDFSPEGHLTDIKLNTIAYQRRK